MWGYGGPMPLPGTVRISVYGPVSLSQPEAAFEENGELGFGHGPFSRRHLPLFLRLPQDQEQQLDRTLVGGKVPAGPHRPAQLGIQGLDRIGNRYEDAGACVRLEFSRFWRMVRPSGTEAPGARKCGQADVYDELRARVSSWRPLRLARLRRERGSVGVVSPHAPIVTRARELGHATCDRNGPPPYFR